MKAIGFFRRGVPSALLFICAVLLYVGYLGGGIQQNVAAAAAAPLPDAVSLERFVIIPTESQVAYHVDEIFFKTHLFHVATGITKTLQGDVLIDRVNPRRSQIGPITVNISQFASDDVGRDVAIRALWLMSSRYPIATFTPTAIEGLPDTYVQGRAVAVRITGTLRIRQVTRPTTFGASLKLDGEKLTGIATTKILMTDFGFDPPSILGFLTTGNQVSLEFHFTAKPLSLPQ